MNFNHFATVMRPTEESEQAIRDYLASKAAAQRKAAARSGPHAAEIATLELQIAENVKRMRAIVTRCDSDSIVIDGRLFEGRSMRQAESDEWHALDQQIHAAQRRIRQLERQP